MSSEIMPLDDFLALDTEEQIEKLRNWRAEYTLKDIREAWNFKHSAQYYMLLKKLRIYEQVVNKSDKFYPGQLAPQPRNESNRFVYAPQQNSYSSYAAESLREDHFDYQLNITLSGTELAEKLERIANFLKGEDKQVSIKLTLSSAKEQPARKKAETGSEESQFGAESEEEESAEADE